MNARIGVRVSAALRQQIERLTVNPQRDVSAAARALLLLGAAAAGCDMRLLRPELVLAARDTQLDARLCNALEQVFNGMYNVVLNTPAAAPSDDFLSQLLNEPAPLEADGDPLMGVGFDV